jgi:DNA-nicking Smr family endonuclease
MSRPGGKSGKERRLGEDEAELWQQATRSVETVKAKPRIGAAKASVAPSPPRREAPASDTQKPNSPPAPLKKPVARTQKIPPLADFDRRKARQIAAGKVSIDDTLDLHGLTQAAAHARLRTFLLGAHASGFRTVLVITGKGAPGDRRDYLARAFGEREQGVLRRAVPQWLGERELAAVVLSFTPAVARHGGDGALYVQLRKARRD